MKKIILAQLAILVVLTGVQFTSAYAQTTCVALDYDAQITYTLNSLSPDDVGEFSPTFIANGFPARMVVIFFTPTQPQCVVTGATLELIGRDNTGSPSSPALSGMKLDVQQLLGWADNDAFSSIFAHDMSWNNRFNSDTGTPIPWTTAGGDLAVAPLAQYTYGAEDQGGTDSINVFGQMMAGPWSSTQTKTFVVRFDDETPDPGDFTYVYYDSVVLHVTYSAAPTPTPIPFQTPTPFPYVTPNVTPSQNIFLHALQQLPTDLNNQKDIGVETWKLIIFLAVLVIFIVCVIGLAGRFDFRIPPAAYLGVVGVVCLIFTVIPYFILPLRILIGGAGAICVWAAVASGGRGSYEE